MHGDGVAAKLLVVRGECVALGLGQVGLRDGGFWQMGGGRGRGGWVGGCSAHERLTAGTQTDQTPSPTHTPRARTIHGAPALAQSGDALHG